MKMLVAIAAAAAMTTGFVGTAEAKAPASGNVSIYAAGPISPTKLIAFGQLFSGKSACVGERKFKFVITGPGGKVTADRGRTSVDGGISGIATEDELTGATGATFVVAKTEKCAKVSAPIASARLAAKPANTDVTVLTVDGVGPNGAFAGIVKASKASCRENRKVKFLVDGKRVDRGTSNESGSWALHVTKAEFNNGSKFKAVVKKTSKCAGATGKFDPAALRAGWR